MIQRIQTIFLVLALTISTLMIFTPVASEMQNNDPLINLIHPSKISNPLLVNISIVEVVALTLTILICFICVFSFKKRNLQMRLCIVNIIFLILIAGMKVFSHVFLPNIPEQTTTHFYLNIAFPLINIFLYTLAYRHIRKDEHLVKSYDRLR
jgi:hypothetical protein